MYMCDVINQDFKKIGKKEVVISPQAPWRTLALLWCALTYNQALYEVGQYMPYLDQGGHSTWSSWEAVSRMHVCAIFDLLYTLYFFFNLQLINMYV